MTDIVVRKTGKQLAMRSREFEAILPDGSTILLWSAARHDKTERDEEYNLRTYIEILWENRKYLLEKYNELFKELDLPSEIKNFEDYRKFAGVLTRIDEIKSKMRELEIQFYYDGGRYKYLLPGKTEWEEYT